MELQHYLRVVKRYWWIPALLIVVVCTAAYVYTNQYVKPVYQASTDLIVNKTESTLAGQQVIDQNSINTNLMLINTYKQIIKSPSTMKRVADEHPELGLTASQISDKVAVNTMKDAQIITLVAKDDTYGSAVKIVEGVSSAFRSSVTSLMKLNNITVLTEPDPLAAPGPVNSSHTVLYIFCFLLSALLGLGIAFLVDYLDDKVRTEDDIESELGITMLASIGKIKQKDLAQGRIRTAVPFAREAAVRGKQELRPAKEQR
ncbi:YveK family protein [Cohnella sp. JJ-181]|uniref:YveK family protein n=1 Tax=Cohnella rhizoplanae TaxID=2974897 RepID=UPI0022FFBEE8|nr:Wzz/FepE/Etk N-terminal domain-containing protein [Cohnella sp. JJ-181]CAI6076798.1 putative capsular polysaccharide biosynthesis protein YwqC [Cohnella sp. JJ-181]